jgi:hypothetical protein
MSDLPTMWPFGTIDCSNPLLWGVFIAKCAKYSPEAWGQIAGFTNPFGPGTVAGIPAIPGAYDSAALAKMTPDQVQAQVDAALAQQVTDTQANAAAAVNLQGVTIPETAGLSTMAIIAIAVAVGAGVFLLSSGRGRR